MGSYLVAVMFALAIGGMVAALLVTFGYMLVVGAIWAFLPEFKKE